MKTYFIENKNKYLWCAKASIIYDQALQKIYYCTIIISNCVFLSSKDFFKEKVTDMRGTLMILMRVNFISYKSSHLLIYRRSISW